jgi:hypothetical protein
MPKVSKETASHVEQMPGFEGRYEQLGEYTVGFERFDEDIDAAPLFRGLPDDRCQSPHWGVVVKAASRSAPPMARRPSARGRSTTRRPATRRCSRRGQS